MLAVILGLGLLILLVSKKVNVVVAAPAVIMLIALGNGQSPYEMVTGPYLEGAAYFIENFLFIFLLGCIFGKLMEQSGGAFSIGRTLVGWLGAGRAATAIFLASLFLGVGGIAGFVIIFTMYPLGLAVFDQANLPRRLLIPCIGAGIIMAISAPATPQIQNLIPMEYLGTTPTAGFWPGVISVVVSSVITALYLEKQAKKARLREEVFLPPNGYTPGTQAHFPPVWLACIPLTVIIMMLSVFGLNPLLSLGSGVMLAYILMLGYLTHPLDVLNEGTKTAMMPLLFASSSVGFGLALRGIPAFVLFIEKLARSSWDPLVLAGIITNIAAGMMGSASGGVVLTLTTVGGELAARTDPDLLHRVVTLAAAGLDTLPHNNGYLTMLAFSGLTFRETYKDYFFATVLTPVIGLAFMLVLYSLGLFA
ncbi:MAG: GntP family permease [Bacillota bacterium]|nr:GntP family permease [Bacillota bacterium]MDW7683933.1 GntP family permease [Bacillota bacterium]